MKVLVNIFWWWKKAIKEDMERREGWWESIMCTFMFSLFCWPLLFSLFIAFILHTFSFIHSACLWGNLRIGNVRWLRTRWASVSFLFNLYTRQQIVVLVLVIIQNLFIYLQYYLTIYKSNQFLQAEHDM